MTQFYRSEDAAKFLADLNILKTTRADAQAEFDKKVLNDDVKDFLVMKDDNVELKDLEDKATTEQKAQRALLSKAFDRINTVTKNIKKNAKDTLKSIYNNLIRLEADDPLTYDKPRYRNFKDDLLDLEQDITMLSDNSIWPSDLTQRFREVYDTTRRLGLLPSSED